MSDYEGPERRARCEGCIEDRMSLQRMKGANKVRASLLTLLLIAVVGGNGYFATKSAAYSTQVALNAQAIEELKKLAEQNTEEHQKLRDEREEQTAKIIKAINDTRGE